VYGAREHNLKDIDIKIPREKLVVITGLSGSGKSSLAFDTIYAEGQRRYIETFSAYARQFLGGMERPDVDKIEGLSPVIAIEQKTTSKSPRSTVGTITEIYDFLRLLYARAATAYSYNTGEAMVSYTDEQIKDLIQENFQGKKIAILSPLVRSRKGHYRELFAQIAKRGYMEVRVNGEVLDIMPGMKLDRYKTHDIELLIDKLNLKDSVSDERLKSSIDTAMQQGENVMMVLDYETNEARYYSRNLMCPTSGISYPMPEPNSFSFNSPKGACPTCNGLGELKEVSLDKVFPDPNRSFKNGMIAPLVELKNMVRLKKQIESIYAKHNENLDTPYKKLKKELIHDILYGVKETVDVQLKFADVNKIYKIDFEGIIPYLEELLSDKMNPSSHSVSRKFSKQVRCTDCEGHRLNRESLHFKIDQKHIGEVAHFD